VRLLERRFLGFSSGKVFEYPYIHQIKALIKAAEGGRIEGQKAPSGRGMRAVSFSAE